MRAAIYTRISDDRDGLGLGVARQLEDCRDLVDREGWTVVGEYSDNDVSAFSGRKRPGWDEVTARLAAGDVDVLVCWAVDRLYRRPKELEALVDLIEDTGGTVATVTSGRFDLATPEGRAMARVGAAIAASESERKSVRNTRKALEIAQDGKPGGGMRPFGFEPDGLTVRPAEAELLREAARRLLAGEPVRSILRDWTERGVRSSTGNEWRHSSFVRTMLRWRNCGVREHHGEPVADAVWPAILDRETTERLRAMLSDPARRPPRAPSSYMLRGLLTCARCGELLISKPRAESRRAYACAKGPALAGCGGMSALADPLEAEVVARVAARLDGSGLAEAVARLQAEGDGKDETAGELVKLRARLDQLSSDYYEHGAVTRSEYLSRRAGIESQIGKLEARLSASSGAGMVAGLPAGEDAIRQAFAVRDVSWCRAMLGAVLVRVVLHPTKPGPKFRPERVECVWRV